MEYIHIKLFNLLLFALQGDVQYGRTDLGFANLFIMSDIYPLMDFTTSYNFEGMCFVISKPKPAENWLGMKQ